MGARSSIGHPSTATVFGRKVRARLGQTRQRVREVRSVPADDPLRPLYVRNLRHMKVEGYMTLAQARWFRDFYSSHPDIKRVLEIGFNLGHSAMNTLASRPDTTVTSVDIGEHGYVRDAARYIGRRFPGRHELVVGDSKDVIPRLASAAVKESYDLIFIDGGHSYEDAAADLTNCAALADKNTVVILDDYLPERHWGVGPVQAWNELTSAGFITPHEIAGDDTRRWAVGHFALLNGAE